MHHILTAAEHLNGFIKSNFRYLSPLADPGGGQPGHAPPKAQEGGHDIFCTPQSSQKLLFLLF